MAARPVPAPDPTYSASYRPPGHAPLDCHALIRKSRSTCGSRIVPAARRRAIDDYEVIGSIRVPNRGFAQNRINPLSIERHDDTHASSPGA